jgi:hypothetical protein
MRAGREGRARGCAASKAKARMERSFAIVTDALGVCTVDCDDAKVWNLIVWQDAS